MSDNRQFLTEDKKFLIGVVMDCNTARSVVALGTRRVPSMIDRRPQWHKINFMVQDQLE